MADPKDETTEQPAGGTGNPELEKKEALIKDLRKEAKERREQNEALKIQLDELQKTIKGNETKAMEEQGKYKEAYEKLNAEYSAIEPKYKELHAYYKSELDAILEGLADEQKALLADIPEHKQIKFIKSFILKGDGVTPEANRGTGPGKTLAEQEHELRIKAQTTKKPEDKRAWEKVFNQLKKTT